MQTKVNSTALTIHIEKTSSPTASMTLHQRHTLKSAIHKINILLMWAVTRKIHYNSHFETILRLHVFWWKLLRLVSTPSTEILFGNWQVNSPPKIRWHM